MDENEIGRRMLSMQKQRRRNEITHPFQDNFKEQADVLFAIGRYLALVGNLNKAKDYIRRAIKLDGKYRSEFLEDDAFDAVWESFWYEEENRLSA